MRIDRDVPIEMDDGLADADLFLFFRVFTPDPARDDPHTPIAQGWRRASRRKLEPKLSQPWRPYHGARA